MTSAEKYRVRVFYHWKKPEAKERHGFSLAVVETEGKDNESVIAALRKAYPLLEGFNVVIDKLEWR